MNSVGFGARIVVGGFCLEPEQLYVPAGQMRRLKIFFAAGEEQQDMDLALRSIADGRIDIASWIGARIGLSGVDAALHALGSASAPVRTVVDPRRLRAGRGAREHHAGPAIRSDEHTSEL